MITSNNTSENRKTMAKAMLRNWDNKAERERILKSIRHMLKDKAVMDYPILSKQ